MGFWGYEDATGLKAIGFVEADHQCLAKYVTASSS
jgi:hypothetical protein